MTTEITLRLMVTAILAAFLWFAVRNAARTSRPETLAWGAVAYIIIVAILRELT